MPENYAPQSRPGHSTGPRTPNGKAIASRNSTTHGCCSKRIIISGESEEEFNQLLEDWLRDYEPEHTQQRSFVEQAVHAQWILKRNTSRYNELEQSLEQKSVLDWTEEDHKKFERFTRYKTTAERAFTRAFTQLEQLRKRIEREQERERTAEPRATTRTAVVETAPLVSAACSDDTHAPAFRTQVGAAHTPSLIAESVPSHPSQSSEPARESPSSCRLGMSSKVPREPTLA